MKKKNILFVCRFNCTRSQIAAGLFNKLNKNKNFSAQSAGLIQGPGPDKEVKKLARKNKIKLTKPSGLIRQQLLDTDIVIIVADDVPIEIFNRYKNEGIFSVQVWKLPDLWKKKYTLEQTFKEIEKRVIKLIKKLENKK